MIGTSRIKFCVICSIAGSVLSDSRNKNAKKTSFLRGINHTSGEGSGFTYVANAEARGR